MEPREKAKELIEKYFHESDFLYEDLTWAQAKKCALIAVIEIKLAFMEIADYDKASYWRLVELEIEKL